MAFDTDSADFTTWQRSARTDNMEPVTTDNSENNSKTTYTQTPPIQLTMPTLLPNAHSAPLPKDNLYQATEYGAKPWVHFQYNPQANQPILSNPLQASQNYKYEYNHLNFMGKFVPYQTPQITNPTFVMTETQQKLPTYINNQTQNQQQWLPPYSNNNFKQYNNSGYQPNGQQYISFPPFFNPNNNQSNYMNSNQIYQPMESDMNGIPTNQTTKLSHIVSDSSLKRNSLTDIQEYKRRHKVLSSKLELKTEIQLMKQKLKDLEERTVEMSNNINSPKKYVDHDSESNTHDLAKYDYNPPTAVASTVGVSAKRKVSTTSTRLIPYPSHLHTLQRWDKLTLPSKSSHRKGTFALALSAGRISNKATSPMESQTILKKPKEGGAIASNSRVSFPEDTIETFKKLTKNKASISVGKSSRTSLRSIRKLKKSKSKSKIKHKSKSKKTKAKRKYES